MQRDPARRRPPAATGGADRKIAGDASRYYHVTGSAPEPISRRRDDGRMPLMAMAAIAQVAADLLALARGCQDAPREHIAGAIQTISEHLLAMAGRAEP